MNMYGLVNLVEPFKSFHLIFMFIQVQLMVAATLILLCSRPLEVAMFGDMPWLLTVPAIAIIGREVEYVYHV